MRGPSRTARLRAAATAIVLAAGLALAAAVRRSAADDPTAPPVAAPPAPPTGLASPPPTPAPPTAPAPDATVPEATVPEGASPHATAPGASPPTSSVDLGVFRLAARPVVDADTLKLDAPRESVRVLAVDAEEVFHDPADRVAASRDFLAYARAQQGASPRPRKYGTPAGEAAKAFTEAYFAGVTEVRLELDEPGRDRDGFGRRLAHVFVRKGEHEALFAEVLVRAGWAPYFVKYGRSLRYDARLRAAQAAARADRLGIWGPAVAHYPDYETRLAWWASRAAQVDAWAADVAGPTPPPNPIRLGVPAETQRLPHLLGQRVTLFGSLDRYYADRPPRRLLFVDAPDRAFSVVVLDPDVWRDLDLSAVEARFARVSGILSEYRGRLQVVLTRAADLATR